MEIDIIIDTLTDYEVCELLLENDDEVQGMIALKHIWRCCID